MLSTLKVSDAKREEGFTLIELLVVVIIIGILAAIAIPTFLSQREKGWQAEITSGVRNYALEIEAYSVNSLGTYPTVTSGLPTGVPIPAGLDGNPAGTLNYTYARPTPTSFTLCGTTDRITDTHSVTYSTVAGGMQPWSTTSGC